MDGVTSRTAATPRATPVATAAPRAPAEVTPPATSAPSATRTDTATVSTPLGGRDLVMTRLFSRAPGAAEPPVRTPFTSNPSQGSGHEFLTLGDRAFLAKAYETAQQNGIDLTSIDRIAGDMGWIRFMANAAPATDLKDFDGNPLPITFTAEDQAVVDRIGASPALSDTTFPKDLLGSFMDPGRTYIHASDYRDLEAVVNAMSPSTVASTPGGVKAIFEKAKTYPQSGPPAEIPTLDQATIERKLGMNRATPELSERDKKTLAVLSLLENRNKDHIANLFAQVALTGHDPAIIDAFAARLRQSTPGRDESHGSANRRRIDTTA